MEKRYEKWCARAFKADRTTSKRIRYGFITVKSTTLIELNSPPPQYSVFPAGYSQRDSPDWPADVKTSLCKTSVDSLPGNSSSRHGSSVTSKRKSCCPLMSSCA
ncbi:hypothetical protein TNCV_1531931 [Trichonephila clavipes]|nr:hypothetical protein TNCV_1531931 [Trichonephila clavipes]